MLLRKLAGVFACALMIGVATFAMAGVPDLAESTASPAFNTDWISLYNLPDASGQAFNQARWWDGAVSQVVDGTITLTLLDSSLNPVIAYPSEDLWLESRDGGMFICPAGSVADLSTDTNGQTTWTVPMKTGGWSEDLLQVFVSGAPLTSDLGMSIKVNSADINGSGKVELTDVTTFVGDFFGAYMYRSDLTYDMDINLLDVTRLVGGWGAECN